MRTKEEILNIIREAKRILKEKGWTQGSWYDRYENAYCVNGALNVAGGHTKDGVTTPFNDTYISEQIGFERFVVDKTGDDSVEWNDTHTKVGVIRLLSQYEKSVEAHDYE